MGSVPKVFDSPYGDTTPAIKIHLHITSADEKVMARALYDTINSLVDQMPIVKLVEYDGVWDVFDTPDTPETTGKEKGSPRGSADA